jgi:hypothetical protein
MRVTALAFALALLAANTATAACWDAGQVADTGDTTITTAKAPIQTPVPSTADSES